MSRPAAGLDRPRVTGIVLAGGRSRRFGSDKLTARVDGVPLVERAAAALALVSDDVLVVLPPAGGPALPPSIRVVRDPEPHGGPLVGLAAGLAAARAPIALVAGGDMPWLAPGVLAALIERLAAAPATTAAAGLGSSDPAGDGLERFPIALRVEPALALATELLDRGERRLRRLVAGLAPDAVPETTWRAIDPGGRTTVDVDEPGDLPGRDRP